jgi:hypothetical protein
MILEHRSRPRPTRSNLSKGCGLYLPTQRTSVSCTCRSQACNRSTYAKCAANTCGMNTCIIELKELEVSWNEHLQKRGEGRVLLLPSGYPSRGDHGKRKTSAFPATSGRSVRPFVPERKSTPLFSCACTRFCGNAGAQEFQSESSAAGAAALAAQVKDVLRPISAIRRYTPALSVSVKERPWS